MTDLVSGAIHLCSSPLQPVPGVGHNYRKYKNIVKNSSHRSPLCQPYISAPNTTISALGPNRRSAPLRSIIRSLEYSVKLSPVIVPTDLRSTGERSRLQNHRSPLIAAPIPSMRIQHDNKTKVLKFHEISENRSPLHSTPIAAPAASISSPRRSIYRKASLATSTPSCFPLRCFFRFLLAP